MAQVKPDAPKTVGRIVLEDADGQPAGTADYRAHPALRAATLVHQGVTYLQNRVEAGRWHYRATVEPPGASLPHPFLADVRGFDHPQYDGPGRIVYPSELCQTCGQRVLRG